MLPRLPPHFTLIFIPTDKHNRQQYIQNFRRSVIWRWDCKLKMTDCSLHWPLIENFLKISLLWILFYVYIFLFYKTNQIVENLLLQTTCIFCAWLLLLHKININVRLMLKVKKMSPWQTHLSLLWTLIQVFMARFCLCLCYNYRTIYFLNHPLHCIEI